MRRYALMRRPWIHSAVERYREDVERREFPSDKESYHLSKPVRRALDLDSDTEDGMDALVNKDALEDFGT